MATPSRQPTPFWEVEWRDHPPAPVAELPALPAHPRLIFRPENRPGLGRTVTELRRLHETDATFRAIFEKTLAVPEESRHPAMLAACWLVTGDDKFARDAIDKMVAEKLGRSGEPYYSNIWIHALAYDWLHDHPAMTAEKRGKIVTKMLERLATELDDLDKREMALWHGRNQAANGTMIAALALGDLPGQDLNLRRAAAHYFESLRALEFSEGWPEGASYWIYNRPGPYAVAADCAITALGTDRPGGINVREIMRKVALWQVYQFGPNGVFEPHGDSAGSLRLGDTGWWELTSDYFAKLSRDPAAAAAADYIRNRSPEPYGKRPYYWYAAISYDPSVRPRDNYDPARPELWMRAHMPQAMLFGRDSLGVAFFRGEWGSPQATYACFKAGDLLAHHDHYDVGHFSIQSNGGLLAPKTGLYPGPGGYAGDHRLGYLVQSVASNTLLVMTPGETSAYLRAKPLGTWKALSGGQRAIRPTGFDCLSLAHFRAQLNAGPHLERATITAFDSIPAELDYVAADITAAYNSTRWAEPGSKAKVSLVTRQFLYLRREGAFVVYDRVDTTRKAFTPKFLLHHLARPETAGEERQLAGEAPDDGIVEAPGAREITTVHKTGRLTQVVLLPEKSRVLKIGGPSYNCYVEPSGDQSKGFAGVNLEGGDPFLPREGKQLGLWRTEVEPSEPGRQTRFLNLLFVRPAAAPERTCAHRLIEAGKDAHAALVGDTVCVFARETQPLRQFSLEAPGARCVLLDAVPGGTYTVEGREFTASREGVLVVEKLPAGRCEIRLRP